MSTTMTDKADQGDIVSMVDVLEEDNALEEEANAVLGASDDLNCTYPQGYIDRQALYSCLTCNPSDVFAGICFACSLHCHDDHDLVELYTKRNFRCDCGNSKFKEAKCKLFPGKAASNENNIYSHNFAGKYCKCEKPYPDPEDEIEDEMIQCVVCEDWYHSRHLGTLSPVEYQEMICDVCMPKLDFLRWYKSVSVASQGASSNKGLKSHNDKTKVSGESNDMEKKDKSDELANEQDVDGEKSSTEETSKDDSVTACKLNSLKTGNANINTSSPLKATFWPSRWRSLLCQCANCKEMYKSKNVSFITEEEDTVYEYEQRGKRKQTDSSSYAKGMKAFESINRINQVEVLTEYNNMKSELHDYLKSFAGEGKVVTKEDIETFFEGMRAKKRQKMDQFPGVQFFCK